MTSGRPAPNLKARHNPSSNRRPLGYTAFRSVRVGDVGDVGVFLFRILLDSWSSHTVLFPLHVASRLSACRSLMAHSAIDVGESSCPNFVDGHGEFNPDDEDSETIAADLEVSEIVRTFLMK